MPDIDQMRESKYLRKEDCGKGILLTIAKVYRENVARQNEKPEMKWVLAFVEDCKPCVCNVENQGLIAQALGLRNSDDWVGHKIVAWSNPNVSYGGKVTGGIRFRAVRTVAQPAPAPASMQPAQNPNWQRPPQSAPAPAPAPAPRPVQTGPPGGACDEQGVPVDGDDIPF
jgi:hypothetical protein